jgi:hypothetical protein
MLLILAAVLDMLVQPNAPPAERWAPAPVSSPMFESHPAFDPLTGDLWLVRSDKSFRGWRIFTSRCVDGRRGEPQPAPFAGDGVEADPWFTADGRTLYFISTRSTDGVKRSDLDIWRVSRDGHGVWGKPERLPEPVNSTAQEWFPRLGPDGWLYFGSARAGGLGKTDIWRAREVNGQWRTENLGPAINTAGDEYEPLFAPGGRSLLVATADGYFVSRRGEGGWTPRVRLGPAINANGSEIGAVFSPTGQSLMFARDMGEPASGEFLVARSAPEAWPPACPGGRAP